MLWLCVGERRGEGVEGGWAVGVGYKAGGGCQLGEEISVNVWACHVSAPRIITPIVTLD